MPGGAPSAMFQRDDACWELWPWCLLVQPPRRHSSLGRSQSAQPHEPLSRTGHRAGRRATVDLHTPPSQPRGATKLQTAAPSQPGWHMRTGVRRGRFDVADVAHCGRLAILICASRQARVRLAARGVAPGGMHRGIAPVWVEEDVPSGPGGCEAASGGVWLCARLPGRQAARLPALCGPCVWRHAACGMRTIPAAHTAGRNGWPGMHHTSAPKRDPNCRSTTASLPLPVTGPPPTPLIYFSAPSLRELYNTGPDATLQYSDSQYYRPLSSRALGSWRR